MEKNRRRFKCKVCSKAFKRGEHCTRHELMHTSERPYACKFCDKRYGRKDLVRRHERSIHADQINNGSTYKRNTQNRNSPSDASGSSDTDMDPQEHGLTAPNHELQIPSGPESRIVDGPGGGHSPSNHHAHTGLRQSPPAHFAGPYDTGSNPQSITIPEAPVPPLGNMEAHDIVVENNVPLLMNTDDCHCSAESQRVQNLNLAMVHTEPQNQPVDSQQPFLQGGQSQDTPRSAFGSSSGNAFAVYENSLPSPLDVNLENGNGLDGNDLDYLNFLVDGSAFPVDALFKEPRKLTARVPKILCDHAKKPPKKRVDQSIFDRLCRETAEKLDSEYSLAATVGPKELEQFLNTYFDAFHPHLPIIHLPSFTQSQMPSALVLAVASIGALYRLSRRKAYILYDLSERLIFHGSMPSTNTSSREGIWLIQTKILLTCVAVFSGKSELCTKAFNPMGSFVLDYQWNRLSLPQSLANLDKGMTWNEWVYCEETKRALCGIFIISNLLLIAFNVTPGFQIEQDLQIEVPSDEMLWAAETADQWEQLRKSQVRNTQTIQNVLEIMTQEPSEEKETAEPRPISSFTALVVMHAMNTYMWHLNQLSHCVGSFSLGSWLHTDIRTDLQQTALSALERCQASLLKGRSEDYKLSWDDPESTLLFNSAAMLRCASSRIFTPSMTFNKLTLISNDQELMRKSVSEYVHAPLKRSLFIIKASQKAFEGFFIPVTIGHLLVSKTAALHWSVEQAMAGWDSALLLTKWVHTLEIEWEDHPPGLEEVDIIVRLKNLLAEMEVEHDGQHSLAATLSKAWSTFLDDVWVWGITKKMGAVLRLLATQYEERFDSIRVNPRPNL